MSTKDPIGKAREDLERIVRDSNRNIKRAEKVIKNIRKSAEAKRKLTGGKVKESLILYLDKPINYSFMSKLAVTEEIYPTSKIAQQKIRLLRSICEKEEVRNNGELIEGYHENKFSRSSLGWDEDLERTVMSYITHINH